MSEYKTNKVKSDSGAVFTTSTNARQHTFIDKKTNKPDAYPTNILNLKMSRGQIIALGEELGAILDKEGDKFELSLLTRTKINKEKGNLFPSTNITVKVDDYVPGATEQAAAQGRSRFVSKPKGTDTSRVAQIRAEIGSKASS